MKTILQIAIILWKCWFLFLTSLFVLTIGVFWTLPFSFSNRTFYLAYKGIRLWAILIFYGSGFRLNVERSEKLDKKQPYIFISNHTSALDIMIMSIIHKDHPIIFIAKEELTKIPIFGQIYRKICITVDRKDQKSKSKVFKSAKEKIKQGQSIVIFPEGGIPEDRKIILNHFKDGAFTISIATQTPLVLYAFKGPKEMFPWSWSDGYPGKISVKLIDLIPTMSLNFSDKESLKNKCYDQIFHELTL